MSAPCNHAHHGHADAAPKALALALPVGLLLCMTCGVHVCADELAAALELLRLLPLVRLPGWARR